jgi:hypothetical protein
MVAQVDSGPQVQSLHVMVPVNALTCVARIHAVTLRGKRAAADPTPKIEGAAVRTGGAEGPHLQDLFPVTLAMGVSSAIGSMAATNG